MCLLLAEIILTISNCLILVFFFFFNPQFGLWIFSPFVLFSLLRSNVSSHKSFHIYSLAPFSLWDIFSAPSVNFPVTVDSPFPVSPLSFPGLFAFWL